MPPPLLQLSGISLSFGGKPLLDGADLSVSTGERLCLVGRNGSGKSTLLKVAAGLITPDAGRSFTQPGASVRYLAQEPDFGDAQTVLDYVEAGLAHGDAVHDARYLIEHLGLDSTRDPRTLSGGEARRAALAQALAPDPDILLLDEPTNHLDLPTIEWLEQEILSRRKAFIIISHDRRFLENLSRQTVWLDRGQTKRLEMGFGKFETWRDEFLAQEERDWHKLGRKIKEEEHWIRYGVTARRKRNMRRVGELASLRQRRREERPDARRTQLTALEADRPGTLVIQAEKAGIAFDGRPIVKDLNLRILRQDRIGIVGPNGAGKTTLLKLLTGVLPPTAGEIKLGTGLELAALDQGRAALAPDTKLKDALTGGHTDQVVVAGKPRHVIGYMKDFLFAPEQAETPLHVLSGGERARIMLARLLVRPSNLLVLDEPTNDLDLETLDVLEEAIAGYQGTVILISHDRDFLDRCVTSVLVPEGDGRWTEYAGGYQDMLSQRGRDLVGSIGGKASKEVGTTQKPPAPKADNRPAEGKTKLSFKDKHLLETLPGRIEALETRKQTLQKKLDDPAFYAKNPVAFDQTVKDLAAVDAELTGLEDQWLELEMRRSAS